MAVHVSTPASLVAVDQIANHPSVAPPRPRYVAGYTNHALQRMAERGITETQVEAVIAGFDPGIYRDDNDTWTVTDGQLIVVINKNAYIVTGIPGQE